MIRKMKVVYIASDDADFGKVEDEVIVLSSNILLEKYDDTEGLFYITNVEADQETITIDRATCPRFLVDFDRPIDEVDFEELSQITFLDFVRKFAK